MKAVSRLGPWATDMIRADHSRVLLAFHRYDLDASATKKRGLAETICLALEVHAQIEEEIFYPALGKAGSSTVAKAPAEHEEMRRLIAALRTLKADSAEFDATFMDLMRAVMHHMADEETTLLPYAESALRDELGILGGRMMARRVALMAPKAGALVGNVARVAPAKAALTLGALVAGLYAFNRLRRHA